MMREEELLAVPEGGDGGEAALAFPAPLPQQEGQRRHRRVSRRRLRGRRGCAGGFHSSFPLAPVGHWTFRWSAPRFPRGAQRRAQGLLCFDPFGFVSYQGRLV